MKLELGQKAFDAAEKIKRLSKTGAEALIEAIATKKSQAKVSVRSLQEIHGAAEQTAANN